jgi:2-hydroxy-3-oxopropionate reductase
MRVGFVGLGVMGRPMVLNLVRAGFPVVATTRNRAVLASVVAEGVEPAESPREVGARSDVVITMLPSSEVVEEVVAGSGGVLEGAEPDALVIDMGTSHPDTARRLAALAGERGVAMLDAPVSGGDVGAREATLSIMVGGEAASFERARPVFEALGKTITHVGPHGAGQIVKACNQIVVGITYAAVGEALVLGSKSGVDPALILDVLSGGLAANRIMEVRRKNFLEHEFKPGATIDIHHKDLTIALDVAGRADVALPLSAVVQQMMRTLRANGSGGLDHSSLVTVVEGWANHRIGSAGPAPSDADGTTGER